MSDADDRAATPSPELVRRAFGHLAAQRHEAFLAMAHDDVEVELPSLGRRLRGRAELAAFHAGLFAALEDAALELLAVHGATSGHTAVGEWHLTGRFAGAPCLGITPTGRRIDVRGAEVMTWEAGRLIQARSYADGLALAHQLGWRPRSDRRGERALLSTVDAVARIRRRTRLDMPHYR